ncbi:myb family transcription factor PHL8 [Cocos nucifera]|uniref:Myb family transcription factor PHL8 n=1 Tax=Cocos nucifera TaxID=13894 RepID=A0A8K0NB89_COCNU|nr:myb family transcription factor PHL8 [Cocos nucifera]
MERAFLPLLVILLAFSHLIIFSNATPSRGARKLLQETGDLPPLGDTFKEMPNQGENRRLALSVDAKPRLKWTQQLHQRFVDAVSQLGGADTDCTAAGSTTIENEASQIDQEKTPAQFNETMAQMQIEVQRKLREQIEVQRHLQLRIEAQGKYLQSVLRKAQETLAGYSSNSLGVEAAKAELSELVSAVETECLSSSFSQGSLISKRAEHADCSTDSCLTSSLERQEAKVRKQHKLEHSSSLDNWSEGSDEINPNGLKAMETQVGEEKGSCGSIHGEANVARPTSGKQETNSVGVPRWLDLNR